MQNQEQTCPVLTADMFLATPNSNVEKNNSFAFQHSKWLLPTDLLQLDLEAGVCTAFVSI